jgi:hypothetical protein
MYFPITIVDNFYDNFNEVKKLAETSLYYRKQIFSMPGVETKPLNEIHPFVYQQSCRKILALFFNRHMIRNLNWSCGSKFEKIIPYGKDYDKNGWVHNDDNNKLSGILFLQGEEDEGTSFYSNTEPGVFNRTRLTVKEKLHAGLKPDSKEYNENLKKHNKPFKKILTVPNIPNRIVLFDSSILHAADGLGSIKKPRIIQTFFFENISADSFPIPELKRII